MPQDLHTRRDFNGKKIVFYFQSKTSYPLKAFDRKIKKKKKKEADLPQACY